MFRKILIAGLMLVLFASINSFAQGLFLKENGGAQNVYAIANVEKITFDSGKLLLKKTSGTTDSYNLTDIRYLSFKNLETAEQESLEIASEYHVFPIPVQDILNIKVAGENNGISIEILTVDGKKVLQNLFNEGQMEMQVYMGNLYPGMYICKIVNGIDISITKIIK